MVNGKLGDGVNEFIAILECGYIFVSTNKVQNFIIGLKK